MSLLHNELPASEVYGAQRSQGLTWRAIPIPKTHPSSTRGSTCPRRVFKCHLITNKTFVSDASQQLCLRARAIPSERFQLKVADCGALASCKYSKTKKNLRRLLTDSWTLVCRFHWNERCFSWRAHWCLPGAS